MDEPEVIDAEPGVPSPRHVRRSRTGVPQPVSVEPMTYVYVQNINVPFWAMVGLVVKFWLASAVAGIILASIVLLVSALTGGALLTLFGRR